MPFSKLKADLRTGRSGGGGGIVRSAALRHPDVVQRVHRQLYPYWVQRWSQSRDLLRKNAPDMYTP
jgi:hypothetical protein